MKVLEIISMEPVSIGELMTFTSSIILLIITWKSVTNAKRANENAKQANVNAAKANENALNANLITEQSQRLQRDQFHVSIKPDLIFKINPIKYNDEQNDKHKINELLGGDHSFEIKNISSNICYDVSTTTVVYLPNEGWDKYFAFTDGRNRPRHRPTTAIHEQMHSLNNETKLNCHIPFTFLLLNIVSYDGTIPSPEVYTFLKYKDKTKKVYEECFKLNTMGSVIGRRNKLNDIEIHFRAAQVDFEAIKRKVYEQKDKLEYEVPSAYETILFI